MPIYEYRCSSCGFEKEILQKISDSALSKCPACGLSFFNKQISAVAFRLSGSGWYETDFKTKGQKNISRDGNNKEAKILEKGSSDGSMSK